MEDKAYGPLAEAMRIRQKLDNYARVDEVLAEVVAGMPEEEQPDSASVLGTLKERILREEILERGQRLDGRRFDEIRPIWTEVGVLPVRTAHACSRAAKRRPSSPPHSARTTMRRRLRRWTASRKALHAPLQLPAVLGGRSKVPARSRPPGNRSRCIGRARTGACDAEPGSLPLHGSRRVRHPRIQRLIVDGRCMAARWR